MKPVDTTAKGQDRTLSLTFDLPHPPQKVWRALTDPELLVQWLLPVTGFGLEPGTAFTFTAPSQPGWDGAVRCRVVEVEPQRRLVYSWSVPPLETVVTFTLTPTPAGTRLDLEQTGFAPDQKQAFGGARYGWRLMGERLVELLEVVR